MLIGVISDTHGLLRPEAVAAFGDARVEHILHAGDIGEVTVLETLRTVAPITAIRGNIDLSSPCSSLPDTELVELGGRLLYLVHSIHDLDINPVVAGISVVISGHSHRSSIELREGVLYLNPGSAGPKRLSLPVTIGFLTVEDEIEPRVLELSVG